MSHCSLFGVHYTFSTQHSALCIVHCTWFILSSVMVYLFVCLSVYRLTSQNLSNLAWETWSTCCHCRLLRLTGFGPIYNNNVTTIFVFCWPFSTPIIDDIHLLPFLSRCPSTQTTTRLAFNTFVFQKFSSFRCGFIRITI